MLKTDYKTFLISYHHDGAEWCLELPARDYADAKARLARLTFAKIDGELMMKLPAATGPLAIIISAIRNAAYRLYTSKNLEL